MERGRDWFSRYADYQPDRERTSVIGAINGALETWRNVRASEDPDLARSVQLLLAASQASVSEHPVLLRCGTRACTAPASSATMTTDVDTLWGGWRSPPLLAVAAPLA
ncbi:MAG: hypothetical protein M3137_12065 [Actinomycetota bacterium]|nr:hypothetical protein [Actinomycetota bacterium]